MMLPEWLRLSAEVQDALRRGTAVVALESTVITHGLPSPQNLELAIELEEIVRGRGAVPATVAVIGGEPYVGLTGEQLERLAGGSGAEKLSRRDLPVAAAGGLTGGTTVAATAWLAKRAGIPVFATGGIGGVHRGAPPDVSADLAELHRTPILVVCAGAKSILDLAATRETLEALGILVLGWRTDSFPAFYSTRSTLEVDARVENAAEVAAIWRAHVNLGGGSSILLCAPVPEASAVPEAEVEAALSAALNTAADRGIIGPALTPFLLSTLVGATGGATLRANLALLRNNADVAARVAREVAERDG